MKHGKNVEEIESPRSERIRTLEQLLKAAQTDLKVWRVDHHTLNKWEVASKRPGGGGMILQDLWQVKALLRRRKMISSMPVVKPVLVNRSMKVYKKPMHRRAQGITTALLLPDPHFGFRRYVKTGALEAFHDMLALDVTLQVAHDLRPHYVIHLGDILDLPDWSDKFPRSPAFQQTTQPALLAANWWMGLLKDAVPGATHVLLEGNHDRRMELAIVNHLKAAYELRPADELELPPAMSIPRLLALHSIGVKYEPDYPNGEYWLTDNLMCIHGNLARKGGGKTAHAIVKDSDVNTVFGHIHRVEQAMKTTYNGNRTKVIGAYGAGCLCRIDGTVPGVKNRQDWQQGFAVAYFDECDVTVQLYEIRNGRCLFGGRLYVGADRTAVLQEDTGWNFSAN